MTCQISHLNYGDLDRLILVERLVIIEIEGTLYPIYLFSRQGIKMDLQLVFSLIVAGVTMVAWLVRLESKVRENRLAAEAESKQHTRDIYRIEAALTELVKSGIRSDEKMAEAIQKLSLSMERTMERMEHMNKEIIDIKNKEIGPILEEYLRRKNA